MSTRYTIATLLFGLVLLSTLFLEMSMAEYYRFELVLVCIALVLSALVVWGLYKTESWSWPASTVLFAVLVGNLMFVFWITQWLSLFLIGLVLGIVGVVMSVLSIPDKAEVQDFYAAPDVPPLETYSSAEVSSSSRKSRSRSRKFAA